jgi:hypothetical protein
MQIYTVHTQEGKPTKFTQPQQEQLKLQVKCSVAGYGTMERGRGSDPERVATLLVPCCLACLVFPVRGKTT